MHPLRRQRYSLPLVLLAAALLATLAAIGSAGASSGRGDPESSADAHAARADFDSNRGSVYAMTNAAAGNQVVIYRRAPDGQLTLQGYVDTGGLGTGRIRLSSQGPVLLSPNNRWLFVVNVGSDELSVFRVVRGGLRLVQVVPSGGDMPNSVTVDGDLVYVLNNGGAGLGNITGFRQAQDGTLTQLPGSSRPLSKAGADPAQVSFSPDGGTLVVTEKATNLIDTFAVGNDGYASTGVTHPSAGITPFGFDFTRSGEFVVTEAEEGIVGAATASSYSLTGPGAHDLATVSAAVPDFRSEVCWTVITKDERFAYVTNFGDGTISSYAVGKDGSITLAESIAATTTFGQLSIRDHDLSRDDRYLYAIDIASQKVHAWEVERDGTLTPIGAFAGLPGTVAGLAAS